LLTLAYISANGVVFIGYISNKPIFFKFDHVDCLYMNTNLTKVSFKQTNQGAV